MLFPASRAVTVTLKATPLVTFAGAVSVKWVADGSLLVRLKFAVRDAVDATTLYVPAIALAVNTLAVATPLALVVAFVVVELFANLPDAPLAGAGNVTPIPAIGALPESRTVACRCVANAVLMFVVCGVAAVALIDAGAGVAGRKSLARMRGKS